MVLFVEPTLLLLSIALLVQPAVALLVSFAIAGRLTTGGTEAPALHADPRQPRRLGLLRDAAPIGAGVLLSAIYFRCDVYFVSYWHGLETVGMYNAVFRLVEALRLLPAAALAVAFPELVRATDGRPLRRLAVMLTAGGSLTMAVTYVAAPAIVQTIYGATYLPAAPALRVLALALPLFFLNYALTHQVIAWDGQRAFAAITAAALLANVTGNLLLIPSQGMVGAAWSTLLTELVVTGGCVLALREKGPVPFSARFVQEKGR
jgi:O-antigen/teichoic acid export membrane protein